MRHISIQHHLTIGDKVLIGCLIALSFASFPLVRFVAREGDMVQIDVNGNWYKTLSLRVNQTISVPGNLGNTMVKIQQGEVFVVDSPCRNKVCVRTGHISHNGQLIVCAPNKVVVRVTGQETLPYDAVTR